MRLILTHKLYNLKNGSSISMYYRELMVSPKTLKAANICIEVFRRLQACPIYGTERRTSKRLSLGASAAVRTRVKVQSLCRVPAEGFNNVLMSSLLSLRIT